MQPIDGIVAEFRDHELLREDCLFSRSIGFRGRYCIHPDQVATVNELFGANEAELVWADPV